MTETRLRVGWLVRSKGHLRRQSRPLPRPHAQSLPQSHLPPRLMAIAKTRLPGPKDRWRASTL